MDEVWFMLSWRALPAIWPVHNIYQHSIAYLVIWVSSCRMQVLHKIFTSSILLMTCCWESQIGPDTGQPSDLSSEDQRKEHLASWILDQCAKLQFCRVRINAYSVLLKMVYSTAAKGRMVPIPNLIDQPLTTPCLASWLQPTLDQPAACLSPNCASFATVLE